MSKAGVLARGFTPDELAEAIEEGAFLRHDPGAHEGWFEAETRELGHAVWHDVDADADFADFACGFEDAAGNARMVESECEREAADAGADDEDVSVGRCGHGGILADFPGAQIVSGVR